jgi:hypothetical protein
MITKEELHFRRIDMRGFRRSDGLYEIEGRVTDRKPYDFVPAEAGGRSPPISRYTIWACDSYSTTRCWCTMCTPSAKPIPTAIARVAAVCCSPERLRMSSGWAKEVRERLGRADSCTHLRELLIPLATAALQSMSVLKKNRPEPLDAMGRPKKIDSCYAYAAQRELVRVHWPEFHRPVRSEE